MRPFQSVFDDRFVSLRFAGIAGSESLALEVIEDCGFAAVLPCLVATRVVHHLSIDQTCGLRAASLNVGLLQHYQGLQPVAMGYRNTLSFGKAS